MTNLIDAGLRVSMVHRLKIGLDSPAPFISRWVTLPSLIPFSVIYSITHSLPPVEFAVGVTLPPYIRDRASLAPERYQGTPAHIGITVLAS